MKRPRFLTWLLGSRLTAPPIILGLAWYIRQWWLSGGVGGIGLAAIASLLFTAKSAYEVNGYRRWRADWRAMGSGERSRRWRPKPQIVFAFVGGATILAAVIYGSRPDAPPELRQALMPVAFGAAMLGVAVILAQWVYRLASRTRDRRPPVVTVAVRGPVVTLPSLSGCYRRLPPYCQMLLKGRS